MNTDNEIDHNPDGTTTIKIEAPMPEPAMVTYPVRCTIHIEGEDESQDVILEGFILVPKGTIMTKEDFAVRKIVTNKEEADAIIYGDRPSVCIPSKRKL